MRGIILLIVIAVFCLPVLAHQTDEPLLLVYNTLSQTPDENWGDFDFHLMDVSSGETIYELKTELNDCGGIVSHPDGSWLYLSQTSDAINQNGESYLLELETGNRFDLGEAWTAFYGFSADGSKVAYFNREQESLYISNLDRSTVSVISRDQIHAGRFDGNDFVFVSSNENAILLNRWDGSEISNSLIQRRVSDFFYARLSDDNQFLNLIYGNHYGSDTLYFIDIATENTTVHVMPQDYTRMPSWRPKHFQQYANIYENSVWFYDAASETNRLIYEDTSPYSQTAIRDLLWSPDGNYLAVIQNLPGGTHLESSNVILVNIETDELTDPISPSYSWPFDIVWVSDTEFVYNYQWPGDSDGNHDIYRYNVVSGENRQLTNTPDVDEFFGCWVG